MCYALSTIDQGKRTTFISRSSHARARAIAEYRHFERCLTRYRNDVDFTSHCVEEMRKLDARYNLKRGTAEIVDFD